MFSLKPTLSAWLSGTTTAAVGVVAVTLGGESMVMLKFWVALVSMPPLAVPPLSWMRRLRLALPAPLAVKLSTPVGLTAGATLNKPGLLLAVMLKLSVCADSLAGPALIAVAQGLKLCAPAPTATATSGPTVKLGTSFTESTLMVKLCGALVSMPPLAVPPLSCRVSVIVATPKASAAGV